MPDDGEIGLLGHRIVAEGDAEAIGEGEFLRNQFLRMEFGFAGILALIGLFMLLVYRGMHIATRARGPFNQLLAVGLTSYLNYELYGTTGTPPDLPGVPRIDLTFLAGVPVVGGALEGFRPLEPGSVRVYSCGPTVYAPAHVGTLRSFVFADLLVRYLRWSGYRVRWVMNLTDVDDTLGRLRWILLAVTIGGGRVPSRPGAPRSSRRSRRRPKTGSAAGCRPARRCRRWRSSARWRRTCRSPRRCGASAASS